jgi:NADPH2:quinone reductase
MRAVLCREYGPPETLRVEELPDPVAGPGQAVVAVHAAAVNFPDVLILANRYQVSIPLPFIPGSEFAGIVESVGPGVESPRPGDRVFGATFVGAFAERVLVSAGSITTLPEHVDLRRAAAFGVVYSTAYNALRSTARLRAGETLLVLGAAGGVGLAAVDVGRLLEARVIAAASSPEKLRACRGRGAAETIDTSRESLKDRAKALTGGRGVDVVIDPVGGGLAEEAVRATAWRGRYVAIGFASGEIPRIPVNLLLLKGSELRAFNLAPFLTHEPEEYRRNQAELLELLVAGRLDPLVSAVYPLAETATALRDVAERRAIGKLVIDPTRRSG